MRHITTQYKIMAVTFNHMTSFSTTDSGNTILFFSLLMLVVVLLSRELVTLIISVPCFQAKCLVFHLSSVRHYSFLWPRILSGRSGRDFHVEKFYRHHISIWWESSACETVVYFCIEDCTASSRAGSVREVCVFGCWTGVSEAIGGRLVLFRDHLVF